MARVQFSPVPPRFCRRRLVARIADFQSADGSSILLAGTICPVRPMDQDRTLRTFRFGFESRAGYRVVKWWPSGKGTSLSMRTRWVRLPSTSPRFFSALNAEAVEAAACKPVLSQFESGSVLQWAGGGMADTLVLGTSAFGCESSSLSWPTNN